MIPQIEVELKTKIAALLSGIGDVTIERLPNGGNNRLYLVTSKKKEQFVVKHYFTHADDKRNRLNSEFAFISFAVKNGISCLPRPIARDDKNDIAVYSFIKGSKPNPSDVSDAAVKAALDFLIELNGHRDKAGDDFQFAAESCFSMNAHLETVEGRVKRLFAITDVSAQKFVKEDLFPAWNKTKQEILFEMKLKGIRIDEELPAGDRIISPSDFGFHNSIIVEDGEFDFLDFEYAGWDDPAKTAGDFFSQVALPVPMEYLEMFTQGVAALTSNPPKTALRIHVLLPLYRVKWCCIVLNHFLSIDSSRRKFAGNDVDQSKEEQLDKAKKLLDSMKDLSGANHGVH